MPIKNSPASEVVQGASEIVSYPIARSARSNNDVAHELTRRVVSSHGPLEFSDDDVERAKKYLRELVENVADKAGGELKRRNSDEACWAHSERVAEAAYQLARFVYGSDKGKLNRVVILAILHDTVEDFGGDLKDIEVKFGKDMARSVAQLTTPKTSILALRYPDLTAKALPNENISADTQETMAERLRQLKAEDKQLNLGDNGKHKKLKSALSRQHKLNTFPYYNLDEVIVKIADNADSPQTDAKDIAQKRIYIGAPIAPKRSDKKPPKSWSQAKLQGKVDSRTEFHEALLEELKKVWNAYK